MKRPEIENLKAWIFGKSSTGYQRALGMREFEKLLDYIKELEQLQLGGVVVSEAELKCMMTEDEPNCDCPINHCKKQGW